MKQISIFLAAGIFLFFFGITTHTATDDRDMPQVYEFARVGTSVTVHQ